MEIRKEKQSEFHTTRHLHSEADSEKALEICNTFSIDTILVPEQ